MPGAPADALPPVRLVRQIDTHRLIPSRPDLRGESVLARIADSDEHLQRLFELDAATNDRLLAEGRQFAGIGVEELVFGVPVAHVINAAFCHPHPLGGRFNSPERGAWDAAFALRTAQAEVAFHKGVELAEVGWTKESITYDDYLADFSATFHDLRNAARLRACLDPDSYVASQTLAERLLASDSLGVVYPSVRDTRGTCLACFRPALAGNVRRGETYRFTWAGTGSPRVTREEIPSA